MSTDYAQIEIEEVIRPLGSRGMKLLKATNGKHYAARWLTSPLAQRSAVSQFVGPRILSHIGICTPTAAILTLPDRLVLNFAPDSLRWCVGSLCPVDPTTTPIWDFMPTKLMARVSNIGDFTATFAVDLWLRRGCGRQAVFTPEPGIGARRSYRAHIISHRLFDAADDAGTAGAYYCSAVYQPINDVEMDEIVRKVNGISQAFLLDMFQKLPKTWLDTVIIAEYLALVTELERRKGGFRDAFIAALSHQQSLQQGIST